MSVAESNRSRVVIARDRKRSTAGPEEAAPSVDLEKQRRSSGSRPSGEGERRGVGLDLPAKIGRFSVLEVLGQGGMGVVYACYDSQLDRKVAVKLLLRQRQQNLEIAQARLLREAQAMARLSHPNIVTVLEVGTVDEQMYVAMEFIRGQGLDAWVQQPARTWEEILAAFLQAGRGIEAAHRAGIIHRDFKPQNVLMAADGVVKVLDFGLARADGVVIQDLLESLPDSADSTEPLLMKPLTQTGALLGTPAYMSPEQHVGKKVTPASDQFSFCVSLYQSLFGYFPFSTFSLTALRKDVLNGKVAPPPLRSPVPARIVAALRRGMAVEPEERFASMTELLAALVRDPWIVGRRVAVTAVVAAAVGVASFAAAGSYAPGTAACPDAHAELAGVWDPARALAVENGLLATGLPHAAEVWAVVEPQMQGYADEWVAMRNEACQTHEERRQSDQLFDLRTACLDQRRASLGGLAEVLGSADATALDRAASAVGQLPRLATCADSQALTAAVAPPEDPRVRSQVQEWREVLARAEAQENAGHYKAGLELVAGARAAATGLNYAPLLAESLLRQGSIQMETGEHQAADAALEQALLTAVAVAHDPVAAQAISKQAFLRADRMDQPAQALALLPMARAVNARVMGDFDLYAEFLNNMGVVHKNAGAYPEAERELQEALALRQANGQGQSIKTLFVLNNLAILAMYENRTQDQVDIDRQVVALSRRVLGEHHPEYLRSLRHLANGLREQGRLAEARRLLQPVERELQSGSDERVQMWTRVELGELESEVRNFDTARDHFETILQHVAEDPWLVPRARMGLGAVAAKQGDEDEARRHFAAVLVDSERRLGSQHVTHLANRYRFAVALLALGDTLEAIQEFEQILAATAGRVAAPELGTLRPSVQLHLGEAYHRLGDLVAAEREMSLALIDYIHLLTPEHPAVAGVKQGLGEVALSGGQFEVAAEWLRQAEAGYAAVAEAEHVPLALTRLALARAVASGQAVASGPAVALAEQALMALKSWGPAYAAEIRAAEEFLLGRG